MHLEVILLLAILARCIQNHWIPDTQDTMNVTTVKLIPPKVLKQRYPALFWTNSQKILSKIIPPLESEQWRG